MLQHKTSEAVRQVIDRAQEITPTNLWHEPDMSVLREGRREPPPFPGAVLGPYWSTWTTVAAEAASAPVDYVSSTLLCSAAALLGNARWVRAQQDWQEPPTIWSALVGDPSSGKSPGADPILKVVRALEIEKASDFADIERDWITKKAMAEALREKWDGEVREAAKAGNPAPTIPAEAMEPPKPESPRVIVNDSTPEKLAELAAAHAKGLLFFRDELSAWLGGFDRYNGSGAERALWIEAYGGRPHAVDRKSNRKPIVIPRLTIGVLGGIQPDRLTELLSGPDDGLPARFLWSWPEPIPPQRPTRFANHAEARHALWRLHELAMGTDDTQQPCPLVLPLDDAASEAFWEWRRDHYTSSRDLSGALAHAWGKAPGQLLRLALILEHLWWCVPGTQTAPPEKVSTDAIQAAAALIEDYFKPMAARVYGDAALSEKDRLAARLARWILKTRETVANVRSICRTARLPGLKEPEKVRLALSVLEDADWVQRAPERHGETPGRHRENYVVNPRVWRLADGE